MVFQSKTLLSYVSFVVYDIPDNLINSAQKCILTTIIDFLFAYLKVSVIF